MSIQKSAPEGVAVLDLVASKAARAEANPGPGPFVKLAAGYVELAKELPLAAVELLTEGKLTAAFNIILADPADTAAVLNEVTASDIAALTNLITGETLGE